MQPCKKVTKENGIGEALTAKPIEAAFIGFTHCPGFEPPSPMYPFRRRSADFHESIFKTGNAASIIRRQFRKQNDHYAAIVGGRVGA